MIKLNSLKTKKPLLKLENSLLKLDKSFIEEKIMKKTQLRKKEFEEIKKKSLMRSIVGAIISMFFIELVLKNFANSLAISLLVFVIIFVLLVRWPIEKKKRIVKRVEAELPFALSNIITDMKVGKDFLRALKNVKKGEVGKEIGFVVKDIENGFPVKNAFELMNERMQSNVIRRVTSNLYNIYLHGNNFFGLKKLTDDLLLKQRIESKEFGGKMVVYSLVFIAVSAIIPAMFSCFILIGSYFMKIQFSALEIFVIIIIVFPIIDLMVLMMINSKTPLSLRS